METTEAPPLTEEDIALFIESLSDDPLKCEAHHDENGNPCSIEVTHRERLTCRGETRNVCTAEAKLALNYPGDCFYCTRPVRVCWIVNPI